MRHFLQVQTWLSVSRARPTLVTGGGWNVNNRGEQNKGLGAQVQARAWCGTHTPETQILTGPGKDVLDVGAGSEGSEVGGAKHDGRL